MAHDTPPKPSQPGYCQHHDQLRLEAARRRRRRTLPTRAFAAVRGAPLPHRFRDQIDKDLARLPLASHRSNSATVVDDPVVASARTLPLPPAAGLRQNATPSTEPPLAILTADRRALRTRVRALLDSVFAFAKPRSSNYTLKYFCNLPHLPHSTTGTDCRSQRRLSAAYHIRNLLAAIARESTRAIRICASNQSGVCANGLVPSPLLPPVEPASPNGGNGDDDQFLVNPIDISATLADLVDHNAHDVYDTSATKVPDVSVDVDGQSNVPVDTTKDSSPDCNHTTSGGRTENTTTQHWNYYQGYHMVALALYTQQVSLIEDGNPSHAARDLSNTTPLEKLASILLRPKSFQYLDDESLRTTLVDGVVHTSLLRITQSPESSDERHAKRIFRCSPLENASSRLEFVSRTHLRDMMQPTMAETMPYLRYISLLLKYASKLDASMFSVFSIGEDNAAQNGPTTRFSALQRNAYDKLIGLQHLFPQEYDQGNTFSVDEIRTSQTCQESVPLSVEESFSKLYIQNPYERLESCGLQDCVFALSWVLTWFSHDILELSVYEPPLDEDDVLKLIENENSDGIALTDMIYRYLLCRPPETVCYVSAVLILSFMNSNSSLDSVEKLLPQLQALPKLFADEQFTDDGLLCTGDEWRKLFDSRSEAPYANPLWIRVLLVADTLRLLLPLGIMEELELKTSFSKDDIPLYSEKAGMFGTSLKTRALSKKRDMSTSYESLGLHEDVEETDVDNDSQYDEDSSIGESEPECEIDMNGNRLSISPTTERWNQRDMYREANRHERKMMSYSTSAINQSTRYGSFAIGITNFEHSLTSDVAREDRKALDAHNSGFKQALENSLLSSRRMLMTHGAHKEALLNVDTQRQEEDFISLTQLPDGLRFRTVSGSSSITAGNPHHMLDHAETMSSSTVTSASLMASRLRQFNAVEERALNMFASHNLRHGAIGNKQRGFNTSTAVGLYKCNVDRNFAFAHSIERMNSDDCSLSGADSSGHASDGDGYSSGDYWSDTSNYGKRRPLVVRSQESRLVNRAKFVSTGDLCEITSETPTSNSYCDDWTLEENINVDIGSQLTGDVYSFDRDFRPDIVLSSSKSSQSHIRSLEVGSPLYKFLSIASSDTILKDTISRLLNLESGTSSYHSSMRKKLFSEKSCVYDYEYQSLATIILEFISEALVLGTISSNSNASHNDNVKEEAFENKKTLLLAFDLISAAASLINRERNMFKDVLILLRTGLTWKSPTPNDDLKAIVANYIEIDPLRFSYNRSNMRETEFFSDTPISTGDYNANTDQPSTVSWNGRLSPSKNRSSASLNSVETDEEQSMSSGLSSIVMSLKERITVMFPRTIHIPNVYASSGAYKDSHNAGIAVEKQLLQGTTVGAIVVDEDYLQLTPSLLMGLLTMVMDACSPIPLMVDTIFDSKDRDGLWNSLVKDIRQRPSMSPNIRVEMLESLMGTKIYESIIERKREINEAISSKAIDYILKQDHISFGSHEEQKPRYGGSKVWDYLRDAKLQASTIATAASQALSGKRGRGNLSAMNNTSSKEKEGGLIQEQRLALRSAGGLLAVVVISIGIANFLNVNIRS